MPSDEMDTLDKAMAVFGIDPTEPVPAEEYDKSIAIMANYIKVAGTLAYNLGYEDALSGKSPMAELAGVFVHEAARSHLMDRLLNRFEAAMASPGDEEE